MSNELHVRYAEPRDAEAIWSLYHGVGFLYPEKLAAMGDGGRQARATFEALLSLQSDDYRILLCFTGEKQLRSVCTHARFSASQNYVMHLSSDHDRRALLHALMNTGHDLLWAGAEWVSYTFRENNTSVRRLFTAPLQQLSEAGHPFEHAGYDFYSFTAAQAQRLQRCGASDRVRCASEQDRSFFLERLPEPSSESFALQAQGGLGNAAGVGALAERLAAVGLSRERAAFTVETENGPAALAVLDLSPPWWNLSNLSTGMRVWQLGDDPEAATALLARGARWFADRGIAAWTLLLGPEQTTFRQVLATEGLVSSRRYQRLCARRDALPLLNAAYGKFIGLDDDYGGGQEPASSPTEQADTRRRIRYIMDSPYEGQRIEQKTDVTFVREQLEWVGVSAGQKVLDLGCAAGTTSRLLAEMVGPSGTVVGVDGSAWRVAEALRHPGHRASIEYRRGQAEAIPAADGEFDVAWARFLLGYLRDPETALREMVRVTRPGGMVAVANLDGNCTWHYPLAEHLAAEMEQALSDLAPSGFDPAVGRKLYHLAWKAGLKDLGMDVRPYHVIAGRVEPHVEALWDQKLRTVRDTLRELGWSRDRAEHLYRGFMDHLRDESTFTYSVLITVKGRRPI